MALALCLTLLPTAALAEEGHLTHPICGQTCSHTGRGETPHPNDAFANAKWMASSNGDLAVEASPGSSSGKTLTGDDNYVILEEGYYYLSTTVDNYDKSYVRSLKTIKIHGDVTICLNGKQIQKVGNTIGSVFEVPSGNTLTLTDCTGNGQVMCANSNDNGSGVYVNGGILNLYSGQIANSRGQTGTGSNKSNKYGGGVYVNNGTFNMYGGVITGNSANYGGGVYVKSGTFNMNGGTIKNNTSSGGYGKLSFGGAGVYMESGNFIMKNAASVTANTIGYGSTGGAGVYVNGGTFEMNDNASVTGNKADNSSGSSGGGVYVSGGTFEMNGNASITDNKAKNGTHPLNGGGVYVEGGTFTMNGEAKVMRNAASGNKRIDGNGGGVYVSKSGTFNMNDGTIGGATAAAANTADTYGGGVYVESGTFNMNDGTISGNTAPNGGGGVYASSGKFNMNDGAISGNKAKANGGGVFVHNSATFTVSLAPTVTGNMNTTNSAASNVYLMGSAHITIGNQGLNGSDGSIGVTKLPNSIPAEIVIANDVNKDYSGIFFSDDETREVKYDKTKTQLVLKKKETQPSEHKHIWTYRADKATITATCTNTTGVCNVNHNGGSVTINPPANLTQGSNGKTATVTVSDNWKGPAENEITITYWKSVNGGNTYTNLGGAPTEVGKYKASITVEEKTAFVVYNIVASTTGKQEQDPLHLASDKNTLAVGETLKLTVTGGSTDGGVTYRFTSGTGKARIWDNVLTAEQAGTVTFTATKDGNETYNAVTSGPLTITITEPEKPDPKPEPKPEPSQPSNPGGGSSSDRDDYDSNPVIKTETKNHPDGSTTKTETRKDGSVTQTTTGKDGSTSKTETKKDGSSVTENKAADGSTGTVKTDKNGQTEAKTALSNKAVEDAKKSGEAVTAPVQVEATRDSSTAPTVKVELPKNAGETEVEIPVSNAKPGTVAVLVHPDGTEEILKASVPTENGIRLTVDGSATVKIVDNSKDFIDTRNHWAREEIDFVSARELVNGMSATIYAPNASATRAQLWTILARQNDADLNGGSVWYEKAQLWSKDKGISDGTEPNAAINRAQMVTMLWRTMGQPAAGSAANFTDVPADSYYAQAVAWAVESGITTGIGGGRFNPAATCTRAQIAAFLARSMK